MSDNPCMEGDGHVSHDFIGDKCIRCSKSASQIDYARPRTRGELRDLLKKGVACEVVTYGASMTEIMLKGWLNVPEFKTRPSENEGWTVFEV